MCGRYTISSPDLIPELFGLDDLPPPLPPRYNVAPGQVVAVVGLKPDGRRRGLSLLKWGFVPRWAADPKAGPKPINAKAETAATNPAFRDSFRGRRCLLPADGFFEWARAGGAKVPHHIRLRGGGLFAFAGLWDVWHRGDERLATCCVLTVPANDLVRPVHDRMPAILRPAEFAAWLDPATPPAAVAALLRPFPADEMELAPVGPAVNSVKNDGPDCLAPAA